ncbi:MAG TPA: PaaI family thioesterase [Thermoanaerobaculia bacterium]|nr:PaaI family thioesterase [Thermoanaerobaculia bacterium]
MKPIETHRGLDRRLCGEPVELGEGTATVAWTAVPETAADATGLVHGGFVFGVADHAAMLAVNLPTVVLGSAEVRFTKPVRVGERLLARARIEETAGRKRIVAVEVVRAEEAVFAGRFTCLVPDRHLLAEAVPL